MPSFRCCFGICIIEIDRDHVIGLPICISLGEEQYTPKDGSISGAKVDPISISPFVTAAAELRPNYPLRLLAPSLNPPCLCLKVLYLQPKIGHRLRRVRLI